MSAKNLASNSERVNGHAASDFSHVDDNDLDDDWPGPIQVSRINGAASSGFPDVEPKNFWQDTDFQDNLCGLLTRDGKVLETCAHLLTAQDFKPVGIERYGYARWIVAERALEHWTKYHEPIGALLKADILEYAKEIAIGERHRHEVLNYVKHLQNLQLVNPGAIAEKVIRYKREKLKARIIEQMGEEMSAGTLTDERWQEIVQRPFEDNGKASGAQLENGLALLGRRIDSPLFLIDDILPKAFSLFSGPKSAGKTTVAMQLARAVADQRYGIFLDSHVVPRPGRVLFLSLEDSDADIQLKAKRLFGSAQYGDDWRAAEFRQTMQHIDFICSDSDVPRLPAFCGFLEGLLNKAKTETGERYSLVIVDTFWAVCNVKRTGKQADLSKEDYAEMEPLKNLAQRHSLCLLLTCHNRKCETGHAYHLVSGTTGFTGPAVGLWIMRRDPHGADNIRLLTTGGRRTKEQTFRLELQEDGFHVLDEGVSATVSPEGLRRDILSFLKGRNQPASPREIAEALGKDLNLIRVNLHRMAKHEQVHRETGGYLHGDWSD